MIWPSRDDVNGHMPGSCKKLYPSTQVILGCNEILVQTPVPPYSCNCSSTQLIRVMQPLKD